MSVLLNGLRYRYGIDPIRGRMMKVHKSRMLEDFKFRSFRSHSALQQNPKAKKAMHEMKRGITWLISWK